MVEKITREEVKELIEKLRVKKDPPVDYEALGQLAKNTQSSSPDNLAMLMMMMMGNNKGGTSMDKFMEVQMALSTLKALQNFGGNEESGGAHLKDIVAELQKQREQDMTKIIDMISKQKEDEREEKRHKETIEMLMKAIEAGKDSKEKQPDIMSNLLVEMIKDREKVSPLDIYDRVQKTTSDQYVKQLEMEKAHAAEKQALQEQFLDQFKTYVNEHGGNADTMAELAKATQTIDQFQSFAKRLGWVTPSKEEGTEDKLDWRFLLNRALDIATNVSGAVNKPKKNPAMMDYAAEASKLYAKYKDVVEKPDHTPITKEWLAQQLRGNPNLEIDWDRALAEMKKQQPPAQQAPVQQAAQAAAAPEQSPEIEIPQDEQVIDQSPTPPAEDQNVNIYGSVVEGS